MGILLLGIKDAKRFCDRARLRYGDKLGFSLLGSLAMCVFGELVLVCPSSQEDLCGIFCLECFICEILMRSLPIISLETITLHMPLVAGDKTLIIEWGSELHSLVEYKLVFFDTAHSLITFGLWTTEPNSLSVFLLSLSSFSFFFLIFPLPSSLESSWMGLDGMR
jgi:hypothetical protein